MKDIKKLFTPFEVIPKSMTMYVSLFWVLLILVSWVISSYTGSVHLFPTITQVLEGFVLLYKDGLAINIISSLSLCFQAILVSTLVSLVVTYSYTLAFFKPVSGLFKKLRYLPLAGITYYIAIFIQDGRAIQIGVLAMFMTTFLITTLLGVLADIDEDELNHARTMGCNRWEVLWEVAIKGRVDYIIDAINQNLAIVWVMLVAIETIMASMGGIGYAISQATHFGNQGKVVALQLIILLIGIGFDRLITFFRRRIFKFSKF